MNIYRITLYLPGLRDRTVRIAAADQSAASAKAYKIAQVAIDLGLESVGYQAELEHAHWLIYKAWEDARNNCVDSNLAQSKRYNELWIKERAVIEDR